MSCWLIQRLWYVDNIMTAQCLVKSINSTKHETLLCTLTFQRIIKTIFLTIWKICTRPRVTFQRCLSQLMQKVKQNRRKEREPLENETCDFWLLVHEYSSGKGQDSWSLYDLYYRPSLLWVRAPLRLTCLYPRPRYLISICFVDQSVSGTCRLWGILQFTCW